MAFTRVRREQSRWTPELTAAALTSVFTAIYLVTRTAAYSADAVRVASNILAFHRSHDLTALFRAGHLAYEPLGMVVWKIARHFGYGGGILPALEAINCVAGGVGIGALSLLLRSILTRSRAMTVLIPVATGFSFGYWILATDARAEMPSIACSLIAVHLLIRAMLLPTGRRVAAAGLMTAAACVLHIFALVLVPVGIVALCLAEYTQGTPRAERRAQFANFGLYLTCAVVPVLLAYLLVGNIFLRLHGASVWRDWVHQDFAADWWWSPHFAANLRLDGYAFRRALFVEPGGKSGTFHLDGAVTILQTLLYWLALAAWFVAAYAILSATAFLMRSHYRSYLIVALAYALLYTLALTYISPGSYFFWVPVVLGSAIVTAICASYYRGRRGGPGWLVGIGCWTLVFAASNYVQFVGMHLSLGNNPWLREARQIERRTQPGDLLVVSGFGDDVSTEAYVPFFAHRAVFSLRDSLNAHHGSSVLTSRDLSGAVVQAISSGHRAYAYGDIWSDMSIRLRLQVDYKIATPQQLFTGLQRAPAWRAPEDPDEIVWKLIPVAATTATSNVQH